MCVSSFSNKQNWRIICTSVSSNVPTWLQIDPSWETETGLFVLLNSPSVSACPLLFDSDSGFFVRVLGRHQACMLDERGDPLEVFPQTVHLPPGHQHQPVVPDHHPASGTRTNLISIRLAV